MPAQTPVAAIFESLKGSWRLRRSLKSALPGFPAGIFEGVASFRSRDPKDQSVTRELLYTEQGELKTDEGLRLSANRKYIYRYSSDEDKISAWFVREDSKQNDGFEAADGLFHDLEMTPRGELWTAQGDHLCEKDMYWAYYEFRPSEAIEDVAQMNLFGIRYKVEGPQKDYTSDSAYERINAEDDFVAHEK